MSLQSIDSLALDLQIPRSSLLSLIKTINSSHWRGRVDKVKYDERIGVINKESFYASYSSYIDEKTASKESKGKKLSSKLSGINMKDLKGSSVADYRKAQFEKLSKKTSKGMEKLLKTT